MHLKEKEETISNVEKKSENKMTYGFTSRIQPVGSKEKKGKNHQTLARPRETETFATTVDLDTKTKWIRGDKKYLEPLERH